MKDFIYLGGFDSSIFGKTVIDTDYFSLTSVKLNNINKNIKTTIKPKSGSYTFEITNIGSLSKPYAYSLEIENLYMDFPIVVIETWEALASFNYRNNYGPFDFATNFPQSGTYSVESPLTSYISSLWSNGSLYSPTDSIEQGKTYYSFTFFTTHISEYNGAKRAVITNFCEYCILKGNPSPFSNPNYYSSSFTSSDYTSYQNYSINLRMNNIYHVNRKIKNIDIYLGTTRAGKLKSSGQRINEAYYFNKFYQGESTLYLPGELIENSSGNTRFLKNGNLLILNDFDENAESAAYKDYFEAWKLIETSSGPIQLKRER